MRQRNFVHAEIENGCPINTYQINEQRQDSVMHVTKKKKYVRIGLINMLRTK